MTRERRPDGYFWKFNIGQNVTVAERFLDGGKTGKIVKREMHDGEVYTLVFYEDETMIPVRYSAYALTAVAE